MLMAAIPCQPFVIRMADGREYRIDSPEFVTSLEENPQVTIKDGNGQQHFLFVLLMTSIESAAFAEVV